MADLTPNMTRKEALLACGTALLFVAVCTVLATRNLMWMDEFLALHLIQDPSWAHMLQSWKVGADSGGLLFYVLNRLLVAVTGAAPLVVRFVSAICFAVAGLLWYRMLRERFRVVPSAFAVAVLWFGTPLVQSLSIQVRFYGLLMLTFSLAVFLLDRLARVRSATAVVTLACLLHALLLSSHMLGLIYSAEILFAALFAAVPVRKRVAYISGGLASWLLLLVYLPAVRGGASKLNWIPMPHLIDVVRFHIQEPFGSHPLNLLVVLTVGVATTLICARAIRGTERLTALPVLAVILAFTPILFAIVSHLYRPIVADRYLVPCLAGLAYLFAYALTAVGARLQHRPLHVAAAVAGVVAVACLYLIALRQTRVETRAALVSLEQWPASAPIAIADHSVFEQLEYDDAAHRDRYVYLLPDDFRTKADTSILSTVWQQGYVHNFFGVGEVAAQHPAFLYAQFPSDQVLFAELIGHNAGLCYRQVATVSYGAQVVPMLQVSQRRAHRSCDAQR